MQVLDINVETGDQTYRDMTPEELAQRETDTAAAQAAAQAREETEVAAQAQRQADAQVLMAALPTQEAKDALGRLLGL